MLRMSVNPKEGFFMVFVFINELQKVESIYINLTCEKPS